MPLFPSLNTLVAINHRFIACELKSFTSLERWFHRTISFSQIRSSDALKSSVANDLFSVFWKSRWESLLNFRPTAKQATAQARITQMGCCIAKEPPLRQCSIRLLSARNRHQVAICRLIDSHASPTLSPSRRESPCLSSSCATRYELMSLQR